MIQTMIEWKMWKMSKVLKKAIESLSLNIMASTPQMGALLVIQTRFFSIGILETCFWISNSILPP